MGRGDQVRGHQAGVIACVSFRECIAMTAVGHSCRFRDFCDESGPPPTPDVLCGAASNAMGH